MKVKRKSQREIGTIEGIISVIDLMRINYVGHNALEWIIRDTRITTKEMKKYGKESYENWKECVYKDTLMEALKLNDEWEKKR
jgi:hypothetical protein